MMLLESLFSGFQVIRLPLSCDLLLEPQAEAWGSMQEDLGSNPSGACKYLLWRSACLYETKDVHRNLHCKTALGNKKNWNLPESSSIERINRIWYIYTMEWNMISKRNVFTSAGEVNLKDILLSKNVSCLRINSAWYHLCKKNHRGYHIFYGHIYEHVK